MGETVKATSALRDALDDKGWSYQIDEGGGAFYGPKIDLKLRMPLEGSGSAQLYRCRLLADGTIASWALLTNRHSVPSHNDEIAQGFVDFCQLRPRPASEHLRLHERFGFCLIIVKRCSNCKFVKIYNHGY
ncbi:uncharacterized protein LOC126620831 [Malus sylvestris]|uniref:uncharacterized protein LOC126620831 n=1 Tax=Malus sylvestris TaxID=3752 RepID=UPI0021AC6962|nr:uncharacterized protein LOC126620831 [Malus sylvestris]